MCLGGHGEKSFFFFFYHFTIFLLSGMLSSLTVLLPDSFCLSLQLEVLHSQTLMLIRERWGDLVQEERYVPAKYLTLSVWKYDISFILSSPF